MSIREPDEPAVAAYARSLPRSTTLNGGVVDLLA